MINKPTSNYKMSKQLKTALATTKFKDAHERGHWKRVMIDAEIEASKKVKAGKEDKE